MPNVGIGTTSPTTKLEVTGSFRVGDGGETCDASHTGAIRYNGGNLQFCAGSMPWTTLGVSGSGLTALTGDVTASGTGSVTATVASVGGSTAANVHSAELLANAATDANTASTIVKRDGSGNFSASAISATSLTATGAVTQGSAVFKDSGSNTVTVQAPTTVSSSYVLKWPTSAGGNDEVLKTDASGNLSWTSLPTALPPNGAAAGDLSGSYPNPTVATVGTSTAANIHSAELLANAATAANTSNAIVKRDGTGNFTANVGTFNGIALNNAGSIVNLVNPMGAAYTLTLPTGTGTSGQVLTTNGSGVLSWTAPGGASLWTTHAPNISYDGGGNVGIGTTSPGYKLDVNGQARVTSLLVGDGSTALPSIAFLSSPGTGLAWVSGLLNFSFNGSQQFVIGSNYVEGNGAASPHMVSSFLAGNPSTPGYAFKADEDTGMFTPGANIVAFSTGSNERVRITDTGNIGIGTTSPAATLNVAGSSTFGIEAGMSLTTLSAAFSSSDMTVNVASTANYPSSGLLHIGSEVLSYTGKTGTTFTGLIRGLYTTTVAASVASGTTVKGIVANFSPQTTTQYSSGMTVYNSAAVVIGTQESSATLGGKSLTVGHNSRASGSYGLAVGDGSRVFGVSSMAVGNSVSAYGIDSQAFGYSTTADSYAQATFGAYNLPKGGETTGSWVATDPLFVVGNGTGGGASRSTAVMVLKNGNVGIGTTAPSLKLDVAGSAIFRGPTVGGIDGELFYDTSAHAYQYYNGSSWIPLGTGTITYSGTLWNQNGSSLYYNTGNVGIGTTDPGSTLEVNGAIAAAAGSASLPSLTFSNDSNTGFYSYGADQIGLASGGTVRMTMTTLQFGGAVSGTANMSLTAGATTAASPAYNFTGDSDTGLFRPLADTLAMSTGGTEKLRVASSGNVGIGTTNPGQKLSVVGVIESSSGGFKFPDGTTQSTSATPPAYSTSCARLNGDAVCVRVDAITGASSCKYTSNMSNAFSDCTNQPFSASTNASYTVSCFDGGGGASATCVRTNTQTGSTTCVYTNRADTGTWTNCTGNPW